MGKGQLKHHSVGFNNTEVFKLPRGPIKMSALTPFVTIDFLISLQPLPLTYGDQGYKTVFWSHRFNI